MGRYSQLYSAKMKNKILLVEDELDMSLIVADTLCAEGYDVATAADGASGLNKFITEGADLVIADVMMPKMNGYETTKAIRNLDDRPDGRTIPIIAMTANAFAEDVQASLDAGMNGHLSKPIVMDEVVKTITRHLDRSKYKLQKRY